MEMVNTNAFFFLSMWVSLAFLCVLVFGIATFLYYRHPAVFVRYPYCLILSVLGAAYVLANASIHLYYAYVYRHLFTQAGVVLPRAFYDMAFDLFVCIGLSLMAMYYGYTKVQSRQKARR